MPGRGHDRFDGRVPGRWVVLTETIAAVGLDRELSTALARWRLPLAIHDPGKVVLDLAVTLALGADCLADIALVRTEPGVYGLVASDPTVSRTIARLAADAPAVLTAIAAARASARARAWRLAGERAPDQGIDRNRPLIIDVDATLVNRPLNWVWHTFLIRRRAVSGWVVPSWRVAPFKV